MTGPSTAWSDAETRVMLDNFPHSTQQQMLLLLPGRTKGEIKAKAKRMGLRKTAQAIAACNRANCRGKDLWDEEEERLLRKLWVSAPLDQVYPAFAPRRGKRAVARKAEQMGLRRPKSEIIKHRAMAGRKAIQIAIRARAEKARVREQQEEESLRLQRVFSSASESTSPNIAMALATPLEAAWRGMLA